MKTCLKPGATWRAADPATCSSTGSSAPTENGAAFLFRDRRDLGPRRCRRAFLGRHEGDARGVTPDRWEVEPDDGAEEVVRHLDEDPRSIARLGVCTERSAVSEVLKGGEAKVDDLVARPTDHVGDEGDTARVVLVSLVVKANGLVTRHGAFYKWVIPSI